MVNKQYQGKHDAGYDLCAHVTGKVCNGGQPGGTATLKDMSHDGQKAPAAPRVDGEMFVVVITDSKEVDLDRSSLYSLCCGLLGQRPAHFTHPYL